MTRCSPPSGRHRRAVPRQSLGLRRCPRREARNRRDRARRARRRAAAGPHRALAVGADPSASGDADLLRLVSGHVRPARQCNSGAELARRRREGLCPFRGRAPAALRYLATPWRPLSDDGMFVRRWRRLPLRRVRSAGRPGSDRPPAASPAAARRSGAARQLALTAICPGRRRALESGRRRRPPAA